VGRGALDMVVYVQIEERGFYDDFWLLRRNTMYL
jgi:hypothetical protein